MQWGMKLSVVGLSVVYMKMSHAAEWRLTPQSQVGFSINSLGMNIVHADFPQFQAAMSFDPAQPQRGRVAFTLQVPSMTVSNASLKAKILGKDFFDAKHHQTVHFKSTQIKVMRPEHYQILGQLTLRGVTQPVVFDAWLRPNPSQPKRLDINATTYIRRSDFGMKKSMGGVAEKVSLHVVGQWQMQQP